MDGLAAGTKESVVRGASAREPGKSEWVAISGALRKFLLPMDVLGMCSVNRGRESSCTLSAATCQLQHFVTDLEDAYLG